MFNKISSFFSVLTIVAFLFVFSANDVFAQKRQMPPGNSTIPILSETTMESIVLDDLDTDLVKKYIGIIVLNESDAIPAQTTEAQVAATLVKSLSKRQLASFGRSSSSSASKQKACVGNFCTTAQCSDLSYGGMWASLGLCVE